MINLIPQTDTIKKGDLLPFIFIPVNAPGRQVQFNDFQWWAPTQNWDAWLTSNPRSWQAESIEYPEGEDNEKIYEFFVDKKIVNPSVVSFEEFNLLLNEEENDQNQQQSGQSQQQNQQQTQNSPTVNATAQKITPENKKSYTKFIFALNKLKKAGKIKEEMSPEYLEKGETYAIIGDLPSADGSPVKATKQAYKMKVINEFNSSVLVSCDETIPFGKLPEDNGVEGEQSVVKAIAGWGMGLATTGVVAIGSITAWSATAGLVKRFLFKKAVTSATTTTAAAVTPGAFGKIGAALTSSTFLWAAAIIGAYQIIQRVVNFTSKNQAPRLGEIEDEGWARDMFMPGTIEDGESITICWTQSAGNNWFTDLLWNEDTRTTMDLVKLGDYNGRSVFILIKINSKEYSAILKSKEMVLVAFPDGVKVERGYFDNDELDFSLIEIDKNDKKSSFSIVFEGACLWNEFLSEYQGADDSFVGVPENAPDEYSFHFKYGKNGRDINVRGSLVKNIDTMEGVEAVYNPEGAKNESEEMFYNEFIEILAESSEVLSFAEFSEASKDGYVATFEADETPGGATGGDPESGELPTQTARIAAYDVTSMEYADLGLQGQDLPSLLTFIIPNNYLESEDQDPIEVDPVQKIKMKYPKRGTVIVESEPVPDPVLPGPTGSEEQVGGGVPVDVTKGEILNVYRDRPEVLNDLGIKDVQKIKDKDRKDEINILDMITPEEKKELGIEDWGFLKLVKIYKDGKTKEPILVKFRTGLKKKKFKPSDSEFTTALAVAERVQAGFRNVEGGKDNDEEDERDEEKNKKDEKTPEVASTETPSNPTETGSTENPSSEQSPENTQSGQTEKEKEKEVTA